MSKDVNTMINAVVKSWENDLKTISRKFYLLFFLFLFAVFLEGLLTSYLLIFIVGLIFFILGAGIYISVFRKSKKLVIKWQKEFKAPLYEIDSLISKFYYSHIIPDSYEEKDFFCKIIKKIISYQKKIISCETVIDDILKHSSDGIFIFEKSGRIVKVGHALECILKMKSSDLIGLNLKQLISSKVQIYEDFYNKIISVITEKGLFDSDDLVFLILEGEQRFFSFSFINSEKLNKSEFFLGVIKKKNETLDMVITNLNNQVCQMQSEMIDYCEKVRKQITKQEEKKQKLEIETKISKIVRNIFLEKIKTHDPRLEYMGVTTPALTSSGSCWYVISLKNSFFVIFGNISGQGSTVSLVKMSISGYLFSLKNSPDIENFLDVDNILIGIERLLLNLSSNGLHCRMTCFSCVFNFQEKVIRFANAGHCYPIIVRKNKKAEALIARGTTLGSTSQNFFEKKEALLMPEDFLLFYTESLVEHKKNNIEYGKRQLRKFVENHCQKKNSEFLDLLLDDLHSSDNEEEVFQNEIAVVVCKVKSF